MIVTPCLDSTAAAVQCEWKKRMRERRMIKILSTHEQVTYLSRESKRHTHAAQNINNFLLFS